MFFFMKPTGVKNNRKTQQFIHTDRVTTSIESRYTLFTGITVLYSLSFSYNMHRKDWKFTLIKLGCVHINKGNKKLSQAENTVFSIHFLRVLQARPPATVRAWGARENHVCPPLAHFYDWESWGKRGEGAPTVLQTIPPPADTFSGCCLLFLSHSREK